MMESYIWAFDWDGNQWPWMTLDSHCAPLCTLWNANLTFSVLIVWELVKIDFCHQQQNVTWGLILQLWSFTSDKASSCVNDGIAGYCWYDRVKFWSAWLQLAPELARLVNCSYSHDISAMKSGHVCWYNRAAVLSDAVVNYFLVDLYAERHFVALRRYLLLQDGEYTQSLTDQLFNKVRYVHNKNNK